MAQLCSVMEKKGIERDYESENDKIEREMIFSGLPREDWTILRCLLTVVLWSPNGGVVSKRE